MPKVKFIKEKKEIEVEKGANLRQVAIANGVSVYAGLDKYLNCRGHGTCGTCRVHLKNATINNAGPMGAFEKLRIALSMFEIGHEDEVRLSCQTQVMGDLEVETTPPFNWFGAPPPRAKMTAAAPPAEAGAEH